MYVVDCGQVDDCQQHFLLDAHVLVLLVLSVVNISNITTVWLLIPTTSSVKVSWST